MTYDPSITWGENVVVGEHVVIEKNATIGNHVVVGSHVVIKEGTCIGDHAEIGDLVVLGKSPSANKKMARKPIGLLGPLVIGAGVKIGSNTVIYRGVILENDVLVGDLASIRENVTIGEGSIVGRNAIVEPKTIIGRRVTIQTGCYITSDMVIEDDVFLGPCVSTSNDKYMGMGNYAHQGPIIRRGARIGNNATLLPGITIGEEAIVGAGAVITKDVPAKQTYVGNPGKAIR
jgi:acetyltransferase-like isoleucine patch superfamily enzyme